MADANGTSSLLKRAGPWSVGLAVVVFLLNMAAAWYIVGDSTILISKPLVGESTSAVSAVLAAADEATPNQMVLLNRVVDTELLLRTIQNRQSLTVVSMCAAFALIAIGFALFVMGAEGAFSFSGEVKDRGTLVLQSASPGLLCFVLAAIIVGMTIKIETNVTPPGIQVFGPAGKVQEGQRGKGSRDGIGGDDIYIPPIDPKEENPGEKVGG